MNKELLKDLLTRHKSVEKDVILLEKQFGLDIHNDPRGTNFYSNLEFIIYKLYETYFNEIQIELIIDYIYDDTDDFEELWNELNKI